MRKFAVTEIYGDTVAVIVLLVYLEKRLRNVYFKGIKVKFSVKEIYHTIQGEGARSGRAAIFCRFQVVIFGLD